MQRTTLICNNFSGINRSGSQFTSSVITASDMQNVELFSTENNSGVGIRTSNGNVAISDYIPEGEFVGDQRPVSKQIRSTPRCEKCGKTGQSTIEA